MNSRSTLTALTAVLLSGSLLGCSMRAITPNTRVARSALDYNLQVEEAQNKNLLINVWRAKKRYPLYLTDISKVTGSLTNTYTLGLSLSFGHIPKYQVTTTPSATFTTTPTFDVNLLDTQDFMRGFLAPVSPSIFAHFWRQGWPRELLLHLLVRELQVVDPTGTVHYFSNRGHRYLTNYPNPLQGEQEGLAEFSEWAHYLARFSLAECQKFMLTGLATKEFGAVDSATKALASGLNFTSDRGDQPVTSKATTKTTHNFAGSATSPATTVKEDTNEITKDTSRGPVYNFTIPFDILVDDVTGDPSVENIVKSCAKPPAAAVESSPSALQQKKDAKKLTAQDKEQFTYNYLMLGDKGSPAELTRPSEKEASVLALFSVPGAEGSAREPMLVKLYLRSPEAVLYYLGELARLEDYYEYTQRVCINGFPQPVFVAYSAMNHGKDLANCGSLLEVEDGEHEKVFIPPAHDPNNPHDKMFGDRQGETGSCKLAAPPIENENEETLSFASRSERALRRQLQCNAGRSMAALDLLSDLISLQKSAKDFPTTPTVKIIGQ
jgi:hypothetical protein